MYGVWAGFFTRVKCTVNGQTFVVRAAAHQTYTHQKTKSEIGNWLAPWYFCIPAPRGDVKYTVMTKIKIALIRLMYYLTLA